MYHRLLDGISDKTGGSPLNRKIFKYGNDRTMITNLSRDVELAPGCASGSKVENGKIRGRTLKVGNSMIR